MRLTDTQCEKLRDVILDIYPIQNKADLESLLNDKFNDIKLELTVTYSELIQIKYLNQTISKNNRRRKKIKVSVLSTTSKSLNVCLEHYETDSSIQLAKKDFSIDRNFVKSHDDIRRAVVKTEEAQIFHFISHGDKDGSLNLENNNVSVEPKFLESLFEGRGNNIQCVFINACNSKETAARIGQHINYVIGMNGEIKDNAAIDFAKGFYDGLGLNKNHQDIFLRAFNEGIRAITDNSQKSIPVLYKKITYEEAILNLLKKLNEKNKINELLEELKNLYSTNSLLTKLISYNEHPLKDYLSEFEEIFQKITDSSAIASASQCIFPDNPPDKTKIISALVTNDCNRKPSPLSIVKFANCLAAILEKKENKNENPQSPYIRDWLAKIPSEFKIEITAINEDEYNSQEIHTYLLIIVDGEDKKKFNLRAEYILEDEDSQIVKQESLNIPEYNQKTGISCNSFNEISHDVKKYHDELYNQLSPNELKDITIELFLPIQYLKENLDKEWYCDDGFGGSTPIVREYNIVLRPSDRIQNNNFLIPLYNNFERFKKQLSQYSDEDILNEEIEIINQKVDSKNFQKISDNFKDKKIGIKLIHNDIPDTAFFQAMIRGAAAIAFWKRDAICNNRNFDHIDNYLKSHFFQENFRNLIKEIHNQRKEASNDEKFYPIGFLCDNPYRIPSIFKKHKSALKPF